MYSVKIDTNLNGYTVEVTMQEPNDRYSDRIYVLVFNEFKEMAKFLEDNCKMQEWPQGLKKEGEQS